MVAYALRASIIDLTQALKRSMLHVVFLTIVVSLNMTRSRPQ